MFWKSSKIKEQLGSMARKISEDAQCIRELEEAKLKLKRENEELGKQIIKYQAICRDGHVAIDSKFKPAKTSSDAMHQFRELFDGDFYCLDDAPVDILNIFLEKINALKQGNYKPSVKAINACDDFFKFEKALRKREYLEFLYILLDIKKTSRRFESFNNEIGHDELISIIETLFTYIASHEQ